MWPKQESVDFFVLGGMSKITWEVTGHFLLDCSHYLNTLSVLESFDRLVWIKAVLSFVRVCIMIRCSGTGQLIWILHIIFKIFHIKLISSISEASYQLLFWVVLSDEQMSNGWPFSPLNDEQMSNKERVEHQPVLQVILLISHLISRIPVFLFVFLDFFDQMLGSNF